MGLRDLLTPDNYRDYVLPALGITEAIATRGRSPGTAAQGQMTAFDKEKDDKYTKGRQATLDAQTAAKDALQNRLGTLQIGNAENEQAQNMKKQAALDAISKRAGTAIQSRVENSIAPAQETNAYQYGGEFKGQSPMAMQALQVDPEKGLFDILANDQKAPLVSSEIYRNLHSADAATMKAEKTTDKSDWAQPGGAGSAGDKKEANKQQQALNKEYKTAVSSSKSGINLGSADLAYNGIQKTLDSKTITPADVLIIRDQLVKMVNPGYQITSVQFGHSNLGGVLDKLDNILSQAQGTKSLTDKQKNEYRGIVSRLGSDLKEQHSNIKNYYNARAHDLSTRNNWTGDDSLKVETMPYSFDSTSMPNAGSPVGSGGWTQADEDRLNALTAPK